MANNKTDIYTLMSIAAEEINRRLSKNQFTDDWQWNDSCFQFVVCSGTNPFNFKISDPYRFCYDADEEWAGTAEEQLADWINRWF